MAKEGETPKERMRGLAALSAISEAIGGSLDLDETLNKALEKVTEFLEVEIGLIFLLGEEKRQAQLVVHRGLSHESVQLLNTLQLSEKTIERLAQQARRGKLLVVIETLLKRTRLLKDIKAVIARERVQSYLPILLVFREDILGGMIVASREPREFTPEEIDLSVAVSRQIGVAIENARLYEELRRELTERKRMEEDLLRLSNAVRISTDGIITIDMEGKITDVNQAALRMYGTDDRGELIGKNGLALIAPEQRENALAAREVVVEKGYDRSRGYYAITKGGSRIPVEISAAVVKDADGKPIGLVGISRDITERKRAEEALRESEELYRAIFEQAADSIVLVDAETGALVEFNDRAYETLGYTREEFQKLSILDIEVIESAEEVEKFQERIRRDRSYSFETQHRTKGGEIRNVQVNATVLSIQEREFVLSIWRDITERKRMEEVLRESEERFRLAFEDGPLGMAIVGLDYRILEVNRAFCKMLGYTEQELAALTFVDITHPEDIEKDVQLTEQVFKGEIPSYKLEKRYIKKNQEIIWVDLTATVIRDQEGKALYGLAMVEDITERKRMEEALRESGERYRAIFEQAADSIVLVDAETGALVAFNERAHESLGYTRQEFEKLKVPDFEVIESAEKVAKHIEKVVKEGSDTFETKQRTKSGEIRDILVSARAISIGGRDFVQGIWRDITERKRAEEVLQESEEKYRNVVERATDGITIIQDMIVKYVNPRLAEMWGGSVQEVIGTPFTDYVYPDELPQVLDRYQRRMAGKDVTPIYETVLRHKDGGKVYAELNAGVITYQGKPANLVIVRDITERKRAEEALRRHAQQLEALRQVGLELAAQLDLDTLLHSIVSRAVELMEGVAGGLYLYRPEREVLEWAVAIGDNMAPVGTVVRRDEGLSGKVWETGQPLIVDDYRNWEGRAPIFKDYPWTSVAGVPVRRGEEFLGVLNVLADAPRTFSPADAELLSLFATEAAIAIENARLYSETIDSREKAEWYGERMRILQEIATSMTSTLSLNEVLQRIANGALKSLRTHAVALLVVNEMDNTLELMAPVTSLGKGGVPQLEKMIGMRAGDVKLPIKEGQNMLVDAVIHKKIILGQELVPDMMGARPILALLRKVLRFRAITVLPLLVKDKAVGVITFPTPPQEEITEEEKRLMAVFANQAAIAIENARLYEQTDEKLQHRVAELTALNAITASMTTSLELHEMLQSIVTRVAQMMRARICTIRLMEGGELTIGAAVGYEDESARQHRIRIDERLARIVRDQQPLMVEDLWTSKEIPPSRRERAKREGTHSFLGVPMISKGETIGVLSIYGERPHRFTEEEINLLLTIANQAAIAIENARLYERLRGHAEDLQRLVQERTKELEAIHAELLQSAKLATLGQLAAGVAHELNNPLGAISGYLELLQEEMELEPQGLEYMQKAEKRIQQATKIVKELRSAWAPPEPVWQIVDVNDILEETLNLVERRLSLRQIEVQREMAPDLPQIHADQDRLSQVFVNIITNARQAMPEGGALRVISRESRNGEWVEIIFADTGEGIAKEHLNKIFDPFFTTRRPGEGMGLGLSVSNRYVRDHGGVIDVWSERGRGTVFRVALPTSETKRCWEILDCSEKERCKAVLEKADYRCWSVLEDAAQCERCEVYKRKALPPLDETLLPE